MTGFRRSRNSISMASEVTSGELNKLVHKNENANLTLILGMPMEERLVAPAARFAGHPQLYRRSAKKRPILNKAQQSIRVLTPHTPVLPRMPTRIRRLVNAAYAALGGAEHMSLDQWRVVERELVRKLENEY